MYAELKQKKCKKCIQLKELGSFRFRSNKGSNGTYESYCKECERKDYKVWASRNSDKLKKRDWVRNLNTKFGITEGEYWEMYEAQANGCAICGAPRSLSGRRLAVDHDHSTKLVRELLCNEHNTAIGLFKEDIPTLEKAIRYLQKFKK